MNSKSKMSVCFFVEWALSEHSVNDWTKGHGNALLMEPTVLGTPGCRNNGRVDRWMNWSTPSPPVHRGHHQHHSTGMGESSPCCMTWKLNKPWFTLHELSENERENGVFTLAGFCKHSAFYWAMMLARIWCGYEDITCGGNHCWSKRVRGRSVPRILLSPLELRPHCWQCT